VELRQREVLLDALCDAQAEIDRVPLRRAAGTHRGEWRGRFGVADGDGARPLDLSERVLLGSRQGGDGKEERQDGRRQQSSHGDFPYSDRPWNSVASSSVNGRMLVGP